MRQSLAHGCSARWCIGLAVLATCLALPARCALGATAEVSVAALLSAKDVRPGLVVHIGCGDGNLTAGLRLDERYLVHGISASPVEVAAARRNIEAKGVYGPVSVDVCALNRLPYADNMVNVVVVEDFAARAREGLTLEEIVRVLAPYGCAFIKGGPSTVSGATVAQLAGGWVRVQKPYPEEMDEWSQFRHDASRAAISGDKLVDPPTALRWIAGGYWTDEHGWAYMKMVSAGGRVFYKYNIEEKYAVKRGSGHLIVARDAFNGLKLWEKRFPHNSQWVMNFTMVATADRLYIPGKVLDAATGKDMGKSLLYRAAHVDNIAVMAPGSLYAIDLETGKELWRYPSGAYEGVIGEGKVFAPLYAASVGDKKVKHTVCLDLKTGREIWKVPSVGKLLCYRDGLIFTTGMTRDKDGKTTGINSAISARDGRLLWTYEYPLPGHGGRAHIWFLGGLAWVHAGNHDFKYARGESWRGLDPQTGKVVKTVSMDYKVKHRCAPHRATEKYVLGGGMDLFDFAAGRVYSFHGARGACSFGYMPANGLLYSSTTVCMCFAHLRGIPAVVAEEIPSFGDMRKRAGPMFVKGPAYGKAGSLTVSPGDWPTLRHDPGRFGATRAALPAQLRRIWSSPVGRAVTSPVVAGGLVFAAAADEHRVVALDADTGRERWRYGVGGRVDAPPTIHNGLALFGCRDGWVHCLTADEGEPAWRFRAAPEDKRIVSRGQLESAWPVPGSVVVVNDTAYFAAGRHSEIDGGIFLYALNPGTGKVLWEKQIQREKLFEQTSRGGIGNELNDVLTSNGEVLFMHLRRFSTRNGEPAESKTNWLWGGPCGFTVDTAEPPYGWKHEEQRQWKWKGTNGRWRVKGTALSVYEGNVYGLSNDTGELFLNGKYDKKAWKVKTPTGVRPKALTVAGGTIFVAAQSEEDASRGEIQMYRTDDGRLTGTVPLAAAPRFDGMAVVPGRLYVSTQDGRIICLGR